MAALSVYGGMLIGNPAWAQSCTNNNIVVSPTSISNGSVGTPYNQLIRATDSDSDDSQLGSTDPDDIYTYVVTSGYLRPA